MGEFIIFLIVGSLCAATPFIIEKVVSIIRINKMIGAKFCKSTVDDGVYCNIISINEDDNIVHYIYCDINGNYFKSTEDKVFTAALKYFVKTWKRIE